MNHIYFYKKTNEYSMFKMRRKINGCDLIIQYAFMFNIPNDFQSKLAVKITYFHNTRGKFFLYFNILLFIYTQGHEADTAYI